MKRSTRPLIAALAVLGLVAGGASYAAAAADTGCGPQTMGRPAADFAASRLDRLHAELKLSPEQEAAWKAWAEPIRQQSAAMRDRRGEREAMTRLPAPERMEKTLERMKEHERQMEAGLASLRSFYATLTPEQRQTFDRFQPFGEKRGRHADRPGRS